MPDLAPPPVIDATLRELTELSRRKAATSLFQGTVCRFDGTDWWVMHRAEQGWSSYGRCYGSLHEIAVRYRLRFVGIGRDEHSIYVAVVPL